MAIIWNQRTMGKRWKGYFPWMLYTVCSIYTRFSVNPTMFLLLHKTKANKNPRLSENLNTNKKGMLEHFLLCPVQEDVHYFSSEQKVLCKARTLSDMRPPKWWTSNWRLNLEGKYPCPGPHTSSLHSRAPCNTQNTQTLPQEKNLAWCL